MNSVANLEPKPLWQNFAALNAVPRPSKKEERVIAFAKQFGESLNLPTQIDHIGNVIIKKPATKGMEDRVTVVMQSHLDMVHQKNADTDFDFLTEGIKMFVEGDWVKAEGTTLGADNGIGVATIMALLASKDIPHPPLEALFTIDEETGMTGALELKGGLLDGKIMLNLDTEDDNELTIGCAGGIDITATGDYVQEKLAGDFVGYELQVKGLSGGHSGMDIHKGLGNANKLINRLLYSVSKECKARIASIDGGGLRNAIPRESFSILAIPTAQSADFEQLIQKEAAVLKSEYATTDADLEVVLNKIATPKQVINYDFQKNLIRSIYACPNGIFRMSPDIADLVQTSNNLARVLVKDGNYEILCLTRSSVDSEKMDLARAINSTFRLIGADVKTSGEYPGWTPQPKSDIVEIMSNLYRKMFKEEPHVNACHAGLECGILGTNYPEMEMISFGPNIRGAHSPDERVQISSVQKFWKFTLETLLAIPKV
ncbi:MAG: aminoacyl-histidine dipeptidase [Saprospiraceae bacterium]